MSNSNQYGLILPKIQSYLPGAGNPRDSAAMEMQNMNAKQNSLINAVGGKRHKKYKGGSNNVVIPQYQMPYRVVGGPGTTPNDQIANLSSIEMQSKAWSIYDNKATIKGGKKGCYGCYKNKLRLSKRYKTKRRNKNNKRTTKRHY